MRILVVEDDALLGDAIQAGLRQQGFVADWVRDGVAADLALESGTHDAAVLDIGLPRRSGLEVLARLRGRKSAVPVLILTARDTVEDRIAGLDAGADDYLVKPFDMGELAARLRALTRRAGGSTAADARGGRALPGPRLARRHLARRAAAALAQGVRAAARLHARRRKGAHPRASSRTGSTAGARRSSRTRSRCTCTTCAGSSTPASCRRSAAWAT